MKKGFTLLEILIALTIVGVIGVITVSGGKGKYTDTITQNYKKKYCQILNEALYMASIENRTKQNELTIPMLEPFIKGKVDKNAFTMSDGTVITLSNNSFVALFPNETQQTYTIQDGNKGIDCSLIGD